MCAAFRSPETKEFELYVGPSDGGSDSVLRFWVRPSGSRDKSLSITKTSLRSFSLGAFDSDESILQLLVSIHTLARDVQSQDTGSVTW